MAFYPIANYLKKGGFNPDKLQKFLNNNRDILRQEKVQPGDTRLKSRLASGLLLMLGFDTMSKEINDNNYEKAIPLITKELGYSLVAFDVDAKEMWIKEGVKRALAKLVKFVNSAGLKIKQSEIDKIMKSIIDKRSKEYKLVKQ